MIPFSLEEVAALCPGRLDAAPWADEVTGVQIDSRRIEEGDLFFAVGGARTSAATPSRAARRRRSCPEDAFAELARARQRGSRPQLGPGRRHHRLDRQDLDEGHPGRALPPARAHRRRRGGHNNEIGLPLTLTRIEPDTEVVVCEMGMRGLGQIAELCAIARPDVGVITSIGPVHLELLGTVERVARGEGRGRRLAARRAASRSFRTSRCSSRSSAATTSRSGASAPGNVECRSSGPTSGSRVAFDLDGAKLELEFPFTARHQAQNAVAALLALQALGLPFPEGRVDVELSRWRGEESPLPGGGLLINDSYNANPASMRAALEHLAEHEGRKVAVLGEMAELGPTAPRLPP